MKTPLHRMLHVGAVLYNMEIQFVYANSSMLKKTSPTTGKKIVLTILTKDGASTWKVSGSGHNLKGESVESLSDALDSCGLASVLKMEEAR